MFNEMVHAYIAAKYYVYLTEAFGKRGEMAFIHGTQLHTEQRGRRMAQLAIRNGESLDYPTYNRYSEWVNTDEIIAAGYANRVEVTNWGPDYCFSVHCCPWHEQFKRMGLPEAGTVYCAHLDNSIVRGFNPYLQYDVVQTLHTAKCCKHVWHDAHMTEETDTAKRAESLRSFEYLCASSYWAYREVTLAIFRSEGAAVVESVLQDFIKDYGTEMANALLKYENTNFNVVAV